jgi:hypothetical protein
MHRINSRFGPPLSASLIGQLAWLRCTENVNDYTARFMELSCRNKSLTEHQQIQLYIAGLSDPLRTDVQLQQPTKLDDAVIFARAYEQRNAARTAVPQPARGGGRFSIRAAMPGAPTAPQGPPTAPQGPPAPTSPGGNKQQATTLRLSPAEIAQRCKENKCFHCDEAFVPGHKQHCKQLFVIKVVADAIEEDEPLESDEPTISIQGRDIVILLDSGSSSTFISSAIAAQLAGVSPLDKPLSVKVASVQKLHCVSQLRQAVWSIQELQFSSDLQVLPLDHFDMILGYNWFVKIRALHIGLGARHL